MKSRTGRGRFLIDLLENRVLLSGDLDPTFGTGGLVQGAYSAGAGTTYSDAVGYVQSDGKLLGLAAATNPTTNQTQVELFRFLTNGSLDTSFGTGGSVVCPGTAAQYHQFIAEDVNGDIFVADGSGLFQLSSTGVLNTAFSAAGTIGASVPLNAMVVDGSNLIIASQTQIQEITDNGSVVSAFGDAGSITFSSTIESVLVTPAGQVVVMDGNTNVGSTVYEFNSDGSANTSFAAAGEITFSEAYELLLQTGPAGQIYVVSNPGVTVTRLTASGAVDSAFGSITAGPALAVEPDGSIISLSALEQALPTTDGDYITLDSAMDVAEYTSAEVPVDSFGTGGQLTALNSVTSPTTYSAVAVQSDRKVIVGGIANGPDGQVMYLTRCNVDGSLDTTFGNDGSAEENFGPLQAQSITLLVEPNGQIAAAGNLADGLTENTTSPTSFGVTEFTANGALITTFGTGGEITFQNDEDPLLAWQDGELLVGSTNTLRRLTATGTLDSTFPTGLHGGQALAVQSDNKILAGSDNTVYRYNENGTGC